MLFPALGMTTAVWLVSAALLGLETGFRAEFTVTLAVAVMVLAPLSVWYQRAGFAMAALGIALGFANFGLSAPLGALASGAMCAVTLILAGMAPRPIAVPAIAAARTDTDSQRVKASSKYDEESAALPAHAVFAASRS